MCVCVGGGGEYEEQDKMERGLTGKDGDQNPGKAGLVRELILQLLVRKGGGGGEVVERCNRLFRGYLIRQTSGMSHKCGKLQM